MAGAGFARCELFLRVVSDERGNVREQYRGDELIVRRIEQCREGEVLKGTIVNRKFPDTGGLPLLLVLGSLATALVSARVALFRRSRRTARVARPKASPTPQRSHRGHPRLVRRHEG